MSEPLTMLRGDCRDVLPTLPAESVHCCVTSPPYWGLRSYLPAGHPLKAHEIGSERTPEEFVAVMVDVFREVRRVLREDGTLFLNLGDSYASGDRATYRSGASENKGQDVQNDMPRPKTPPGLKPKDMCGIPWRVALALQADGWYLRSDIIWHKPNPMPESVTDRPTKAHEYVFLLAKSERYFYDAEEVKEPLTPNTKPPGNRNVYDAGRPDGMTLMANRHQDYLNQTGRNKRTVWTIPTAPYSEAHFATFPPKLVEPCILVGTSARGCCPKCGGPWERVVEKTGGTIGEAWNNAGDFPKEVRQAKLKRVAGIDLGNGEYQVKTTGWRPTCECGEKETVPCVVLDPFGGSGTVGQVAIEHGRRAILIELNDAYTALADARTNVTPGLQLA